MEDKKKLAPIAGLTPELQASIDAQVSGFMAEAKAEGKIEGATAERARIQAVEGQSMPGHEALIGALKFDGKTTGPEAAVLVINAEREKKAKIVKDIRTDAPAAVEAQPTDAEKTAAARAEAAKKVDPQVMAKKAKHHFDAMEKAGTPVTMIEAVKHVYAVDGVPL
jgi:uncharacterized protein YfdQ (DUF2303 family)